MVDSNTLLQTDATVIAGVLVLLTIYSLELPRSNEARGIRRSLDAYCETCNNDPNGCAPVYKCHL